MRYCFILIVIAVILVTCCGNSILVFYNGERKTSSEVGTIEIDDDVYLMSIDTLTRRYQAISKKYIEVLPGQHTIGVNYRSRKGSSTKPILLSFNAAGGHTYHVKARAGSNFWTSWIIDISIDSIVAGSADMTKEEHRGRLMKKFVH